MALNNILKARDQQRNSLGQPLAGGEVFLHEPGTSTFITSYRDSGLVSTHTNPVKLSGSGRANIWITRDCDLTIKDRNGNLILQELAANPDALGLSESGGLVPNGSVEIDADADGIPDGYTLVNEAGSTNAIDTSESTDGAQSFRFTSSGVGGGSLTTTDFFPVNDVDLLRVNVDLRSTVAAVRNIVRVEWYDASTVAISNSDIYDSTANPTVFTTKNLTATPPALARFAKLRLIGIDPSVGLAGSTFFDHLSVFYPVILSGVFDNITIQNNEIISTNVNGSINLQPNGTGVVAIQHTATDVFVSTADGADFTAPAANDVVVDAIAPATQAANYGARADGGGIRIRVFATGLCDIVQTTSTGTFEDRWIQLNRNGAVSLFHNNINVFQTTAVGIDILGPAAAAAIVDQIAGAGQSANYIARAASGGLQLRALTGGVCALIQTNAAGASEDTWIQFDRNAGVHLFHNNVDKFETTATGILVPNVVVSGLTTTNGLTILPPITAGTGTAYTATVGLTAYTTDRVYYVQIHTDGTGGATTFNFDALGVKSVKDISGRDLLGGQLENGMVAKLLFDGVNLVLLNPAQFPSFVKYKTGDQSISSSVTLVDITDLSPFFLGVGKWLYEGLIQCQHNNATNDPNLRFRLVGNSGGVRNLVGDSYMSEFWEANSIDLVHVTSQGQDAVNIFLITASTALHILHFKTLIDVTTAGNFNTQFAQGTSFAGTSIVINRGSWTSFTKLPIQ